MRQKGSTWLQIPAQSPCEMGLFPFLFTSLPPTALLAHMQKQIYMTMLTCWAPAGIFSWPDACWSPYEAVCPPPANPTYCAASQGGWVFPTTRHSQGKGNANIKKDKEPSRGAKGVNSKRLGACKLYAKINLFFWGRKRFGKSKTEIPIV